MAYIGKSNSTFTFLLKGLSLEKHSLIYTMSLLSFQLLKGIIVAFHLTYILSLLLLITF